MRSQGEVLDVRADDLRFGADEAQRFLLRRARASRSVPSRPPRWSERTEGWPAALYLAALRLRLGERAEDVVEQLRVLRRGPDRRPGRRGPGAPRPSTSGASSWRPRSWTASTSTSACALLGDDPQTRAAFREPDALVAAADPAGPLAPVVSLPPPAARRAAQPPARARRPSGPASSTCAPGSGWRARAARASCMRRWATTSPPATGISPPSCWPATRSRFVQSGALGGRAREWLAQFPAEVVGDRRPPLLRQRAARRALGRPRPPRRLAGDRRARGLGGADARRHRLLRARGASRWRRCSASATSPAPSARPSGRWPQLPRRRAGPAPRSRR